MLPRGIHTAGDHRTAVRDGTNNPFGVDFSRINTSLSEKGDQQEKLEIRRNVTDFIMLSVPVRCSNCLQELGIDNKSWSSSFKST